MALVNFFFLATRAQVIKVKCRLYLLSDLRNTKKKQIKENHIANPFDYIKKVLVAEKA